MSTDPALSGYDGDPLRSRSAHYIQERDTLIPTFAPRIEREDFDRPVLIDGVDQGFTLGQVAPEYRWAICPNKNAGAPWKLHPPGEALHQHEFVPLYKQFYAEHFTVLPEFKGDKPQPVDDDTMKEYPVAEFIRFTVDLSTGKIQDMFWDPDKRPAMAAKDLRARSKTYRDVSEDPEAASRAGDRSDVKSDADITLQRVADLNELLANKDITQKVFTKKMEELLHGSDDLDESNDESIAEADGTIPDAEE